MPHMKGFTVDIQFTFDSLKTSFTHAPILAHWEPNRPLIVETNASDYPIASVLSIILKIGKVHPITFMLQTLQATKLNYDTHGKKLLAIF